MFVKVILLLGGLLMASALCVILAAALIFAVAVAVEVRPIRRLFCHHEYQIAYDENLWAYEVCEKCGKERR